MAGGFGQWQHWVRVFLSRLFWKRHPPCHPQNNPKAVSPHFIPLDAGQMALPPHSKTRCFQDTVTDEFGSI
jgi:hypothetical protein